MGRWLRGGAPRHNRGITLAALGAALLLVAGCGQVITRSTPTPVLSAPLTTPTPTSTPAQPPTATPAPYTPAPTLTPTLIPTPIIHRIASGETLIAIASRYGVSVQVIQDANGITDPRLLRIGQELVIPAEGDVQPVGEPTPLPTPLAVTVGPLFFGRTSTDGLWVLGEVANPGAEALEGVHLALDLVDDAGGVLATTDSLIPLLVLDAGASGPFGLYIAQAPPSFANYSVRTLSAYPAYLPSFFRDLETAEVQLTGERYRSYTVTGVVRNIGPEDAVEVIVVVALYDAMDRVIGFRAVAPMHNLIPRGGETTFAAEVLPVGGPAVRASAVAQGRRLPTPSPVP